MANQFLSKLRFISKYAILGYKFTDSLSLIRLALFRFAAYKSRYTFSQPWRAKLKILRGLNVNINRNSIQHLAIFDELFLDNAYNLDLVDFVPDLIFDIGAHIGLFSLIAASMWPNSQIVAIEPDKDNASWARRNTAQNEVRVAFIEAAASDKSGWMKFNSGGGMGNLSETGDQTVAVVNLLTLIIAMPSKATLLKMDIEGEELNLLPSVLPLLPETCAVFVEIHGIDTQILDFLSKINDLGFVSFEQKRKVSDCGKYLFIDTFLERASKN